MLKTQEIKTTLPVGFPEQTIDEGHSVPAYNTLLVSDTFITGKSRITRSSFYNFNCVLLIILVGNPTFKFLPHVLIFVNIIYFNFKEIP